jgi:hypothetical protein
MGVTEVEGGEFGPEMRGEIGDALGTDVVVAQP